MGVFVTPKPEKAPVKGRKPKDPNAPKRPRGRPRKDAAQSLAKPETDASTSGSEADDLQVPEVPEPTPDLLHNPPPEIAEQRMIYDVVVAVWSPRNKPAVAEKVRNGIALFGDVVKKQRDAWKVKNEALKQAELANTTAIPILKQEVAQFRKTIETIAVQALQYGHSAHLAKYVYPHAHLSLSSFCRGVECEEAMFSCRSHPHWQLGSDENHASTILHPIQSHNKGLSKGIGTYDGESCIFICNRAVLLGLDWT